MPGWKWSATHAFPQENVEAPPFLGLKQSDTFFGAKAGRNLGEHNFLSLYFFLSFVHWLDGPELWLSHVTPFLFPLSSLSLSLSAHSSICRRLLLLFLFGICP